MGRSLIVEKRGLRSGIAFDRSLMAAMLHRDPRAQAASKAATPASILGSGRSLVMTTLTVSGSSPGQTTMVWRRWPVVLSRRRVAWPASVGLDSPVISVRLAALAVSV